MKSILLKGILQRSLYTLAAALLTMTLIPSCSTVHEYPDEDYYYGYDDDDEDGSGSGSGSSSDDDDASMDIVLVASVNRSSPAVYQVMEWDDGDWTYSESEDTAEAYSAPEGYVLRIHMDLFEGNVSDNRVTGNPQKFLLQRYTFYCDGDAAAPQDSVSVTLAAGEYYVLAWADYVPEDDPTDWHYHTDTLSAVWVDYSTYPANWHLRDCSAAVQEFEVCLDDDGEPYIFTDDKISSYSYLEVCCERPVGRWRAVATDYAKFARTGTRGGDLKVMVEYVQYVAIGYNVSTEAANRYISTYTFSRDSLMSTKGTDAGTMDIVGDYLLVTNHNSVTNVKANIYLLDADDNVHTYATDILIPLKQGMETVIRAPFLTQDIYEGATGQSGVNIDEGFSGEFVITVE